jgi:glycerol-3-phosphate dehydrogenase subunit B
MPCGEIAASPGHASGIRFGHARDRALAQSNVEVISGFALHVEAEDDMCTLHMRDGQTLRANQVIVASGGLVGGGIVYTPSDALLATALPRSPKAPFVTSPTGVGVIGLRGGPIDLPGSLFGIQPEALAWPFADPAPMDRVGIVSSPKNVHVAGDLAADKDRTFLEALRSGVIAAHNVMNAVKRSSHRSLI